MRVFVTGATGVLGRRLIDHLDEAGHTPHGLVRDDAGAEAVADRGATPHQGDVLDPDSLAAAIPDVDAIVHAATAIPTETNPPKAAWAQNDHIRVEGTNHLLAVAGDDIDRFVFPSVVWVARQPDGSTVDHTADRHPDRGTAGAAAVERLLLEGEHGVDPLVLRNGLFYAHDDATTREFARRAVAGTLPVVGGGLLGRRHGALSRIHPTDAASAIVASLEADLEGLYHVVDDEPVGIDAFLAALADQLDADAPGPRLPRWLARWFLGTTAVDLLTKPMPASNARFRDETDWSPQFPTYREGLAHVVEQWIESGDLVETADGYAWAGS